MSLLTLSTLAVTLGVATGIAAAALRGLIAFFHNLFFAGEASFAYDANVFTPPAPWGPLVILAPVLGGLVVVFLVRRYAPEAKGHGVPEVMDAIYYKRGRIRPVVVFVKAVASALSIGSGASVGREGPIIQIGSAIGSSMGQALRLSTWQVITLVAAGAGAGIAATFNTPLGGVMFAVELMLPEISARTFLPVVLATGTATYVGRMLFGIAPAFTVPTAELANILLPTNLWLLPIYVALGILCGVAAYGFVRLLHGIEDLLEARFANPYLRAVVGLGGIGVLMYLLMVGTGHYHVDGVGYGTIQAILLGEMSGVGILFLLFLAKLLATTTSLAAGASGGVFAPSLFLGATLGGAFGSLLAFLFPDAGLNAAQFAIIGMAAVVGGGTGAAMTAILMMFEMTTDYSVIVPAIIAVACAIGTRRALVSENIYTFKLLRRGHHIPKDRHSNMFLVRHAREVMTPVGGVLSLRGSLDDPEAEIVPEGEVAGDDYLLVARGQHVSAVIRAEEFRHWKALRAEGAREPLPAERHFIVGRAGDLLVDVLRRMSRHGVTHALITGSAHRVPHAADVLGVISEHEVAEQVLDQFRRQE
ncbi:MAG: chloride channel protein [Alphaproteobacteria bacterium]|nr:MAG: chloride channel protein [Alphaproteobacteria bacterium]